MVHVRYLLSLARLHDNTHTHKHTSPHTLKPTLWAAKPQTPEPACRIVKTCCERAWSEQAQGCQSKSGNPAQNSWLPRLSCKPYFQAWLQIRVTIPRYSLQVRILELKVWRFRVWGFGSIHRPVDRNACGAVQFQPQPAFGAETVSKTQHIPGPRQCTMFLNPRGNP